jgi:hypothetical protein
MTNTRWATLAMAMAFGCVEVVTATSCGTDPSAGAANPDAGADASGGLADVTTGDDGTLPGDDGTGGILLPDGSDACTPAVACPLGVQCGRYVDPCTGSVFLCGSPCPSGQVCASTARNPPAQSCQPKSCAGRCGVVGVDSCGVAMGCGGCPTGQDCVGNQCVPQGFIDSGSSDACSPLTCAPSAQTQLCGTINDGCGHTMQCSCGSGQRCSGGVCGSASPECTADGGTKCGSVMNACGSGNVTCGGCSGANKCVNGTCMLCSAPTCGAAACGSANNGCGPALSCGTCPTSEVCDDGGCCTPMTCAGAEDAGLVSGCGPVNLGCGVKKSCQPCGTGQTCMNGACQVCTPKTCGDFGNGGCGHSDGCGKMLDCCGAQTACQGSICCSDGEVNYNGSCCLPACDSTQPPGAQSSCGQTIICTGGGSGSSSGAAR